MLVFLFAYIIVNQPFIDEYLVSLKMEERHAAKKVDPLIEEIAQKAKEYEKMAIDAKIDRVWKAIPGLNGLKVDVEASYERMKEHGEFNETKLIFTQTSPAIQLHDLPPAPIYKGNPDKPMVSFLINVAWGNEFIPSILATLKKNNVHASFFFEGRWVKNNPDLAKVIADAGHEVGNHSYTHPDMKLISAAKIREEIQKTNEVIKATTGKDVIWLGPPSGSFRDEVVKIAAEEGLRTVLWTVDTIDWQKPSPSVLIERVMSKVHNGAIILMHPTASTAQALEQLIQMLKEKQLEINTVKELLSENRVMKTRMIK